MLWPPAAESGGVGVLVSVVDSGLIAGVDGWAPWLVGVRPNSNDDIEDPDEFNRLVFNFLSAVEVGAWPVRDPRSTSGGILGMGRK